MLPSKYLVFRNLAHFRSYFQGFVMTYFYNKICVDMSQVRENIVFKTYVKMKYLSTVTNVICINSNVEEAANVLLVCFYVELAL